MAAPTKTYLTIPTVLNGAITLIPSTSHEAIKSLAVRSALGSGNQMVIYEAVEYVEPTLSTEIIDQLVLPIPEPG